MDPSTGALGIPGVKTEVPSFATDQVPAGVAVDPCDRFVYVSDSLTNKVSAYTICFAVSLGVSLWRTAAWCRFLVRRFPCHQAARMALDRWWWILMETMYTFWELSRTRSAR